MRSNFFSLNLMTAILTRRGIFRDTQIHTKEIMACEDKGRDCSDAATSQGMPSIAQSHEKLGKGKDL